MIKKLWLTMYHGVIKALYVQVALACIITPILIGWGLPISMVGLLSNLVFTPFLCLFLLLASMVFITHFFHWSPEFLLRIFEWYSTTWLHLLSLNSPSWLIGCAEPPKILLLLMPCAGICGIVCTRRWRPEIRIIITLSIFIAFILAYRMLTPTQQYHSIDYRNNTVVIVVRQHQTTVIVPRLRSKPHTFIRWVHTRLSSTLYKMTGTDHIWQLVLNTPSPTLVTAIHQHSLCQWLTIVKDHGDYSTISHQAVHAPLSCTAPHAVACTDSPQTNVPT